MKDKPNGEDGAPVADKAHSTNAERDEAAGSAEHQPDTACALDAPRNEEESKPTEPESASSPHELTPQDEGVAKPDLALPAPGLPDEPDFAGEPFTSVAEAPDGEPAVATALAWQPEVEPDPEPQSDPELIAADDAAAETPHFEPDTPDGLPARDDTLSAFSEPLAEPVFAAEFGAQEPARGEPPAEPAGNEPTSIEEEPAGPAAETRAAASWFEQAPAEPSMPDEPTWGKPADPEPMQVASLAEQAEAEAASPEETLAQADAPIAEAPTEAVPAAGAPWPEHPPADLPTPAEPSDEQPLRNRIPSVLPVELEAINPPLEVPLFEPASRQADIAQPTIPAASQSSGSVLAAAATGVAATIPQRGAGVDEAWSPRSLMRDLTPNLQRALQLAARTFAALACLVLVLIVLYRWVNPPASTLMLGQWLTGTRIDQRWVPLNRISPYLQRAVITSEDGRFCQHYGVDWGEIEEAIERAREGIPRGGSTISMQVVKNLFLWPSKSYIRKALEFPLTFAIELAWSKQRILEIYLNIAEWGPGVFGAEAAARHHFRKSAATLTPSQAALLAVSLPNPIVRRAGSPGPGMQRLAGTIHARMMANPGNARCVQVRR